MAERMTAALALLGALAAAGAAIAQVTTSAVNGKIVDSKGESLAGATVQVLYKPTTTSNGVIANEEGRYTADN